MERPQRSGLTIGLRERKKSAARASILEASSALFEERGFEGTRIETIAAHADVGVGSVYNHFPTKADILVAVLFDDVGEVVVRTHAIVERGEPSPGAVLREAVGELLAVMERRPRHLWRDLIGHALRDAQALRTAYRNSEQILRHVVRRGIARLRETGRASSRIPLEDATDIVFALAKNGVYAFVFDDAPGAAFLTNLERQIDLVFAPR